MAAPESVTANPTRPATVTAACATAATDVRSGASSAVAPLESLAGVHADDVGAGSQAGAQRDAVGDGARDRDAAAEGHDVQARADERRLEVSGRATWAEAHAPALHGPMARPASAARPGPCWKTGPGPNASTP